MTMTTAGVTHLALEAGVLPRPRIVIGEDGAAGPLRPPHRLGGAGNAIPAGPRRRLGTGQETPLLLTSNLHRCRCCICNEMFQN